MKGNGAAAPASNLIALGGNPNVGKSTVFNALTGLRQHTGNWPGKTVAVARGTYSYRQRVYTVVDLPGTYSLSAHSAEEEVARDFLLHGQAGAVVIVCDATCLERSLRLVYQTLALTSRVIVCVNLLDEARKNGIQPDLPALERHLGVPVVGVSARAGEGLDTLMEAVRALTDGEIAPMPVGLSGGTPDSEDEAAQALAGAAETAAAIALPVHPPSPKSRAGRAGLDTLLTGRRTGVPIMLLGLCVVFWLTLAGANVPSQALGFVLFRGQDALWGGLDALGAPGWLRDVLTLGIYRTLAWVVSVMLPPMAIFFPLFTLLEDFGYLPRVAFTLDHCFRRAKACGKQSLTMCMGLGCNAAGVTGCRIIDSPRERLIAVLTNNFIPCNGRFPTLIALISLFFLGAGTGLARTAPLALLLTGVLLLGVLMTLVTSRLLSDTVLKGEPSFFALELPPYRVPQVGKVLVRSLLDRTLFVLGRAVMVAAPAGLVIWLLANIHWGGASGLTHFSGVLDPFARLLGLDGVILLAFILGFPANEIVVPILLMAYMAQGTLVGMDAPEALKAILIDNGWTWLTAACSMIFCLAHWPCSTTCLTIWKETKSLKWTALSIALPTAEGMILCAAFAAAVRALGWA